MRGWKKAPTAAHASEKGRDPRKDQSYFLFSLRQHQLARSLFPLGEKTKQDTRQVARECQLKTADKEESMEICFVPDNDYGKFLAAAKLAQRHRGEIVNLQGQVLGHHDGIEFYTIGQRKGLGLSSPKPLYVIELDAVNNRVVVGDDSALDREEFTVTLQLDSIRRPARGNASLRQNPLQPPRHPRDRHPPPQRPGSRKIRHPPTRHHPRPGLRLLRRPFSGGWRVD